MYIYHLLLSMESPKPGVSTTVRWSFRPLSSNGSMSTVVVSMVVVGLMAWSSF